MFLQSFTKWNEGNETPRDYLLWASFGVLSLAIGRRVWLDLKQFYVVPNLYILLTGPSGNRKTFARDKAEEILLAAYPDIPMSAECESHQGIIRFMDAPANIKRFVNHDGKEVEYRPYGLFAPELMDYLAINPIGMANFLTNIYDRMAYRYRLREKDQTLINPYLVMCSCTTGDWLSQQLNARTFGQGWGRRTIIICADKFTKMRVFYTPEHAKAREDCVEWLRCLATVAGPMLLEPAAEDFFWKWYLSGDDGEDTFIRAWRSSKHIIAAKLMTLVSLAERQDRVITKNHIEFAIALLDQVELNLPLITDKMGRSELIEPVNAVLQYLQNNKGFVPEKELQARMLKHFRTTMEYVTVLMHLRQTDQVVRDKFVVDGVERFYIALPQCVKLIRKDLPK